MTESEAIKEIETSIELAKMCTQNFERTKEIEAYAMAIKALEKQIPKKPLAHQCTTCGSAVLPFDGSCCSNCGQKIDWSDEE